MIKFLFLVFLSHFVLAHDHVPGSGESHTHVHDYQMNLRLFKRIHEKWNLMVELENITHEERNDELQILLGGKYRFSPKIKFGAYVGTNWGMRHDEDWIKKQAPDWGWRNTKSRDEQFVVLEAIAREDFELIRNLVAELRLRAFQTMRFDKQTIRLRPKLMTTFFKEGRSYCSLFFMHEIYIPMNYSSEDLYAQWTYVGILFHGKNRVDWGPFISIGKEVWSPDKKLLQKTTTDSWKVEEEAIRLGLNFNLYY